MELSARICSDLEKANRELLRGLELTTQLRASVLLRGDWDEDGGTTTTTTRLANKISDSLKNALSMLQNLHSNQDAAEASPTKRRRGSYKRRQVIDTWIREDIKIPFDDGCVWKKYGQKRILDSKHPRDYFRCALTEETQCPARKQVQKVQDDPPVYRTTYLHHHTCLDALEASLLFSGSDVANKDGKESSNLLRFDKPDDGVLIATSGRQAGLNIHAESDTCTAEVAMDAMLLASLEPFHSYPSFRQSLNEL